MNINMILFNFTSNYFDLFRIYTNLYKHVLNLVENMHTAGLPHTAAPLDSRTLPRALAAGQPHTAAHTAAHCRTAGQSCALCRTLPHTV